MLYDDVQSLCEWNRLGTTPAVRGTGHDLSGLSALERKNSRLLSFECRGAGEWKNITQNSRNETVPISQKVVWYFLRRVMLDAVQKKHSG